MIKIEMDWKNRYKDSGFVREVAGINKDNPEKLTFKKYIEPDEGQKKAGEYGRATFTLENNKCYFVKDTSTKDFEFIKVVNGRKETVKKYEVVNFINCIKEEQKPEVKPVNQSTIENPSLTFEVEFMINSFEQAYETKNSDHLEEAFAGMSIMLWNYAVAYEIEDEFKKIQQLFHEGKSLKEVRDLLLDGPKKLQEKSCKADALLSKMNVPIPA